jgi:hypothetical protein
MFSQERLASAIDEIGNSPAEMIQLLCDIVATYQGNEPLADDQTLVAARAL